MCSLTLEAVASRFLHARQMLALLIMAIASCKNQPSVVTDAPSQAVAEAGPKTPGPRLTEIAPWVSADAARVVLRLSEPVSYKLGDFELGKSTRSYIDLDGVLLPNEGALDRETVGLVRGLRVESTRTGGRVSFDVPQGTYRRVFHLNDPFRIVVDFLTESRVHPNPRSLRRVVLDAGHGGDDPGAIGSAGTREKDVALDVVIRTGRMLVAKGVDVVLTRGGDQFVALEERAARANASDADLFLSVHCNAADNTSAKGFEVYVLDVQSSRVADRLARRENGARSESSDIGGILAQMRLADGGTRARHFADLVERGVHASLRHDKLQRHNGGVHGAGFHVLVGARMPAVLAELGYITTPSEERMLASDDYRQKMAEGLANAVFAYRAGK